MRQVRHSAVPGTLAASCRLKARRVALHALGVGRARSTGPPAQAGSRELLQFEAVHAGGEQDKKQVSQSVHCMAVVPADPVPGGQCQGQGQALYGPGAGTG